MVPVTIVQMERENDHRATEDTVAPLRGELIRINWDFASPPPQKNSAEVAINQVVTLARRPRDECVEAL